MNDRYLNFACGFSLGVAAALLLAPKSGADTRNYLASGVDKGRDYIKQQGGKFLDRGKEAISHTAESVTSAIQRKGRAVKEETVS